MQLAIAIVFALVLSGEDFIVDASAETAYTVGLEADSLRNYVNDVATLARNMPGVVEIAPLPGGSYLYRTERYMLLSGTVRTDFCISRVISNDSLVFYRSVSLDDPNYFSLRLALEREGPSRTRIGVKVRVRLTRKDATDIHLLAPILGEEFISTKMKDDLDRMLDLFARRSGNELEQHLAWSPDEN